ncbi:DoxX family protein [Nocardia sp. NPDC127579]|uniref:DoxX family protein n=1 Tax=Nocardia sp. NPDC127579 TaxID=3345402 RepID=UPI0036270F1C
MHTAYVIVTVLAAVLTLAAALVDVVRADWVRANMRPAGIPDWSLYPLAAIKAIGALGLLVGMALQPLSLIAALCLTLYYILAVAVLTRSRLFNQVAYPLPYLLTAAASALLYTAI